MKICVAMSLALLAGFALLGGCSVREPEPDKSTNPAASSGNDPVADASGGPVTPSSGDKMFGGDAGPAPDLGKLEAAMNKTKAAFDKDGSDTAAKKAFVQATVELATATMLDPDLLPKDKYPKALKLYREALKLDPENEEAKVNAQQIVDIYKSMNRPVPK